MPKRGYIFTKKDNAKKGIMATILGVISLATLIYLAYFSFVQKGQIPEQHAAAMLVTALLSLTAFILAAVGLFEKEKYRLFPILGLILNAAALAAMGFIIYLGR